MKKKLIKLLGLDEDATEADIYARIGELKALSGQTGTQEIVISTPQMNHPDWMHFSDSPFRHGNWM